MFDKANWASSCANHTAGFSAQKGGTRIPTRLLVKVESSGCSGRVDGSQSCCMMRSREEYRTNSRSYAVFFSRGHQCGGIGMNYLTPTIHTHIACARNTISPRTYTVCSRPLACCCTESRHTVALLCSCHFTRNCCLSFIRLRCMNDKISWLGRWASQWPPPQIFGIFENGFQRGIGSYWMLK